MGPVEPHPTGATILVKAVPGASRDHIAGVLGDRLKVRIASPPEDGRANEALLALLARALGIPRARVELIAGASRARKTVVVVGLAVSVVRERLGIPPVPNG